MICKVLKQSLCLVWELGTPSFTSCWLIGTWRSKILSSCRQRNKPIQISYQSAWPKLLMGKSRKISKLWGFSLSLNNSWCAKSGGPWFYVSNEKSFEAKLSWLLRTWEIITLIRRKKSVKQKKQTKKHHHESWMIISLWLCKQKKALRIQWKQD